MANGIIWCCTRLITGLFSPDAGGEAIASCGVAIGSFFAGLGDLKRE
jgi:hypothetical protein